jgi:hypothetical protein
LWRWQVRERWRAGRGGRGRRRGGPWAGICGGGVRGWRQVMSCLAASELPTVSCHSSPLPPLIPRVPVQATFGERERQLLHQLDLARQQRSAAEARAAAAAAAANGRNSTQLQVISLHVEGAPARAMDGWGQPLSPSCSKLAVLLLFSLSADFSLSTDFFA